MGLILDLAVIVLGLVAVGSLALLAWTLAVSAVRAMDEARIQVAGARQSVTDAEARVVAATHRASTTLAELSARSRRGERTNR